MAKDKAPKADDAQVHPDEATDPAAPELPLAVPHAAAPVAAASAFPDGTKTVNLVFPRSVTLTLNDGRRVQFPPGVNAVPEEYADHFYLKAHGVQRA